MHPLHSLTAFQTGGAAEYYATPSSEEKVQALLRLAHQHSLPLTVLGGGTNVVAPDGTLAGLVLSLSSLTKITYKEDIVSVESGCPVRTLACLLANKGKKCIEFLYGMPGSIGGACWMNARCYGKEMSECIVSARGFSFEGESWHYDARESDFSYKKSPFQSQEVVITECDLRLSSESSITLWTEMLDHEIDRRSKGHYLAPCAGSVFKNNHAFGQPTGKILDGFGYRGKSQGTAAVSPFHANIIIAKKDALSKDIYTLSLDMKERVRQRLGYVLEHEIIFLGEREQWN